MGGSLKESSLEMMAKILYTRNFFAQMRDLSFTKKTELKDCNCKAAWLGTSVF